MIVRHDSDRLISTWLEEGVHGTSVDYLGETLEAIGHIRQRQAWTSPGRWLPMDLPMRRVDTPRPLSVLVMAALLAVALVGAALLSGTLDGRRLPAPFGPAVTGSFTFDRAGDVFVADVAGRSVRALFPGGEAEHGAAFSPDGTRLAFWRTAPGRAAALWLANADGSGARSLFEAPGPLSPRVPAVTWSPDSGRFAFATLTGELYVAAADGSSLTRIGDDSIVRRDPRWAPTGDLIAFFGHPPGDSTTVAIHVIRPDGSGEQLVLAGGHWIAWTSQAALLSDVGTLTDADIVVMEPVSDGWRQRVLVAGPTDDFAPALSHDGTRIAHIRYTWDRPDRPPVAGQVVVTGADGTESRVLGQGLDDVILAALCWTPDDRYVAALTGTATTGTSAAQPAAYVFVPVDGSAPTVRIPADGIVSLDGCSWQRLAR